MSLRPLLTAVRDALRERFRLDRAGCQVTADGRPDPACGEWFFAVHPGGTGNTARLYLDEKADFLVTITRRTGFSPQDRIGEEVLIAEDGILTRADEAAVFLHAEYPVMDAANALIAGFNATTNGFVEPPVFQNLQYLGPQGAHWFWAEGVDDGASGVAVQLAFGGARRIRANDLDND